MTESRNIANTITTYSNPLVASNSTNSSGKESEGVKTTMSFIKAIENNQIEELINILENESISKITLNAGLMKALQNYRSNSDIIDMIDALLNNNADPNHIVHYKNSNLQISSQEKVTVLMYSCLKGDLQLVHTILKHNPNVNLKDSNNRNALFYSINADKGDNADIVLTLINSGINVNDPEKIGNIYMHSPLTLATQKNMKNTVKTLLEHGADPNWVVEKDGNTALHLAVKNTNVEIIELLLQKGANLKIINNDNYTPLALALKISNTDIYQIIVEEHNKQAKIENDNVNNLLNEPISNNKDSHTSHTFNSPGNSQGSNKNRKKEKKFNKEEIVFDTSKQQYTQNVEKLGPLNEIQGKNITHNYQPSLAGVTSEEIENSKKQLNFAKDELNNLNQNQAECKIRSHNSNVSSQSTGNIHNIHNNHNMYNIHNINFNRKKKSLKYELINYLKDKKNLNLSSNVTYKSSANSNAYNLIQNESNLYNSNNNNKIDGNTSNTSNNLHLSIEIPFEFKEKVNYSNQFSSFISK